MTTLLIRVLKTFHVDFHNDEDGWHAIIRTECGGDLWAGPYDTKKAAVRAARKACKERV